MTKPPCEMCLTLTLLLSIPRIRDIKLRGQSDTNTWTVDIVTDDGAGHSTDESLSAALRTALEQTGFAKR
jgi:hypothetical protein